MNKILLVSLLCVVALNCADAWESIKLENIKYIDLYKGRLTVGNKPIEQQMCFDENERLCPFYRPDYIRCYNRGFSSGQVIWACEARLSSNIRFNQLDVSCETFPGTYPSQGIVILGSCGLRYTLRRGL